MFIKENHVNCVTSNTDGIKDRAKTNIYHTEVRRNEKRTFLCSA